eukprot:477399-Hanusia_phi.AAC.1
MLPPPEQLNLTETSRRYSRPRGAGRQDGIGITHYTRKQCPIHRSRFFTCHPLSSNQTLKCKDIQKGIEERKKKGVKGSRANVRVEQDREGSKKCFRTSEVRCFVSATARWVRMSCADCSYRRSPRSTIATRPPGGGFFRTMIYLQLFATVYWPRVNFAKISSTMFSPANTVSKAKPIVLEVVSLDLLTADKR